MIRTPRDTSETDRDPPAQGTAASPPSEAPAQTGHHAPVGLYGSTGLCFDVAKTLEDVLDAWGLVYDAYRGLGIVPLNRFGIHTVEHATQPASAVVLGRLGSQTVSTLSIMADSDQGLPLDRVYPQPLAVMRSQGRRLMEVGLFADRRRLAARSAASLFELMRWGLFHSMHRGATDIIIGVHPHHAPFYQRAIAFQPFGELAAHPTVCDAPVIPMRLDLTTKLKLNPLPRGLKFFLDQPLGPEAYADRYPFDPQALADTPIEQYLREKQAAVQAA